MSRPTSRVSRVLMTGPLGPFADQYRERLKERRYTRLSAVNLERQAARMSRWLEAEGLGVEQLSEARIDVFVSVQLASGRGRSSLSRPGLLCLLELLRELGVVSAAVVATPSPIEALMESFGGYLLSGRGLSAGTVRGYVAHATRFVAGLAPGELRHVPPTEVTTAVLAQSATVSVSATRNFVAGLRAFLRFCFIEDLTEVDLSQAALPVTGRRRSSLPRGIATDEAAALLGSCDRRTASVDATTRWSSRCCGWGCAGVRWPASDSKTSTGGLASWWWWARAPVPTGSRCPPMSARPSLAA